MEEMNDFSVKLGWDAIIYSGLGAGIFDGEFFHTLLFTTTCFSSTENPGALNL